MSIECQRITTGRTLVSRWALASPAPEIFVSARHGPIHLRIYDPVPGTVEPMLGFLHGGSWAMAAVSSVAKQELDESATFLHRMFNAGHARWEVR